MTVTTSPAGLDSAQRARLERLVIRARSLLEGDLGAQAEGWFGIHADGRIEAEDALPDDSIAKATRRDLVEIIEHLRTLGETAPGAVTRLLREAAFTHLNRLLAIRIAEAIGLLPESLANGRQSRGFTDLAEIMPILGDDYWGYLLLCGDELAADAPALFDPRNPLLGLAPTTASLDELVVLLAEPDIADIWLAPDTLGWAYQFFNTADERKEMRESKAPRTSRELAVRNQFFTPRYVVDFLVQNTLGRRLIENDPKSPLLDELPLLVNPPTEVGPALDLDAVTILDPAVGSGHFLLGCYDVLERAWQLQGVAPSESAPVILASLWGVDIDPRCAQVASAAIVLRARRHCRDLPLPRPNIITARGLPGGSAVLPEDPAITTEQRALVDRASEVLADAPLLGVLLKAEDELEQETRHAAFGGLAGTLTLSEGAFAEAEAALMAHLQTIADRASSSVAERLLAAEADDALRLIEVVRRRYDVVLMNPAFGEPVPTTKAYLRRDYEWLPSTADLFAAFVGRGVELCKSTGYLGAITSRVGLFLGSFERWRREVLLGRRLIALADLGEGVMQQAMVEAAAYVLGATPPPRGASATFFRLMTARDRGSALEDAVRNGGEGTVFDVPLDAFNRIPRSPVVYWVDPSIVERLLAWTPFEPHHGKVRVGLQTSDDFRFVRAWWEVPASKLTRPPADAGGRSERDQLDNGARWAPVVKSGASMPWFSPQLLVVDWERDGERLKNFTDRAGKQKSVLRNTDVYFLPGFSWTLRATRLIPYVVPAGCIPSVSRYQAFPSSDPYEAVGLVASNVATAYCRFFGEWFSRPKFLVDTIKGLPMPGLETDLAEAVRNAVASGVDARRRHYSSQEPFREFLRPSTEDVAAPAWDRRSLLGSDLDLRMAASYGLSAAQFARLDRDLQEALNLRDGPDVANDDGAKESSAELSAVQRVLSYLVGLAAGRWDIRIGLDPSLAPALGGPFDHLPASPPGMFRPVDSGPEDSYPLALPEHGLLVDEPGHDGDIEAAVMRAGEVYLGSSAQAASLVDVVRRKSMRDYLRKQFFKDHLALYSAGGRKAPIYWPLTVPSRSWGVWVYAPMLTRETLFAVGREAARRERLATEAISRLEREQQEGGAGRSARKVAEELNAEQKLAEELRRFRAEAERIAALGWEPDLDDGIVLCAAPLADLFPAWPDAKKARDELRKGRHEWATVARWADEL